jgi:hypothetical protein
MLLVQAMFGGGGVDGWGEFAAGVQNCMHILVHFFSILTAFKIVHMNEDWTEENDEWVEDSEWKASATFARDFEFNMLPLL